MNDTSLQRSFVIPVLDFSPHSPYNIRTLLDDLKDVAGEVICVFNAEEVFEELRRHPRINKFCHNNLNAGVPRSWNIGINMAEGRTVFVMNADLRVRASALDALENHLHTLDRAVIVGPEGTHVDYLTLQPLRRFTKGSFSAPVQTHDVSGFFFAIHLERFLAHRLAFDVRYSPCLLEEYDMGLQVLAAGLACYAAPTADYDHRWGLSGPLTERRVAYFGREVLLSQVLEENVRTFKAKWHDFIMAGSWRRLFWGGSLFAT